MYRYREAVYFGGWIVLSFLGFLFIKFVIGTAPYVQAVFGAIFVVVAFLGAGVIEKIVFSWKEKREDQ